MTEELVFYTNPMSRGRIARWMLEEIGQPYRTELLTFGETMKAPEYLSLNPMGKVPAIRHGNTVVTECAAICAYLADTFPEKGLAPRPEERAAYYRWMFFAAGPLESAVTMKALGFEIPTERLRMAGCGGFGDVINTLEIAVSRSTYIAGERFTAADVYVGSHIGWGLSFGSIEKRQAFIDYFGRISERPAGKRAKALDDEAGKTVQAA
ncbi:glutathione S-transferase family protein [Rhizobium lentis]|uniref:Glutathione S-transferase n=1 Tax=Rhizobium lentis TaxID=1138194 RepID=A0A7W8XC14_9HYPH|nr:glutathione S-transferase family protein [Rhizobium lentis]MBB4572884.1 glutathione S-transferase [Rhizobium lentis]MBB5547927.1 glutathione S-transferase [Rhizobium lentis]MBB5558454.1 glutathione S-transferase [Rhizobium lentis]MBB5566022.1 glutathione S-transferase [Rhizobium lentis]